MNFVWNFLAGSERVFPFSSVSSWGPLAVVAASYHTVCMCRVPLRLRCIWCLLSSGMIWMLVSDNGHKRSGTSYFGSSVLNKKMMRPVRDQSWLGSLLLSFLLCFDTLVGKQEGCLACKILTGNKWNKNIGANYLRGWHCFPLCRSC